MTIEQEEKTESVRQRLRDAALRSTYYMGKVVIGFKDMAINTHGPLCAFIDSPTKRKYGLAPRDHLKTSCWTIADCVRRATLDPNVRILLGNETATNASHMLRRIEAVYERNGFFQWLFPEVVPDFSKVKKWSETEMLLPRSEDHPESTIEVIGVGGAVVSRHFNCIKLDDLVGKEAADSPEVMRKTIDWYQYCESLLVDPTNDDIHCYGTRWANHDLYSWIEEHELDVDHFYRSCYNDDGTALWPERFSLEVLERIKKKIGPYKFSCQYENKPFDPQGQSFRTEWLRYYNFNEGECVPESGGGGIAIHKLRKFMRVDPAISEKDNAARSAIIVDGVDSIGRKFVLDAWAERCDPGVMLNKIFEKYRQWDCESCGVESVAYQRVLQYLIADEGLRRGSYINVYPLKPDTRQSKTTRIRGLVPYFQRGEVFVRKDMQDLIYEYSVFPSGKFVDLLDALAYGPEVWSPADDAEGEESFEDLFPAWSSGRSAITGY